MFAHNTAAAVREGAQNAVAGAIECLTVNVYFHKLFRVSLHMRAALVATLLDKGLRASPANDTRSDQAPHGVSKP